MSDDFDPRLLDLLYGELPPDEAAAFEAELAQDADAQKTVEGWSAVRRAVKDLPTPEPDPQVHYTILRAARDAVAPAKPRGLWAWLSGVVMNPAFAGVAVMALAVGSVMMFQLKDEDPASALDEMADAPAATKGTPAAAKTQSSGYRAPEDEAERAEAEEAAPPPGSVDGAPRNAPNQPVADRKAAPVTRLDDDARPPLELRVKDGERDSIGSNARAFGALGGVDDRPTTKIAKPERSKKARGKKAPSKTAPSKTAPSKKSKDARLVLAEPAARQPSAPKGSAGEAPPAPKRDSAVAGDRAEGTNSADLKAKKTKTTASAVGRRSRADASPARRPAAPAPASPRGGDTARTPEAAAKAFAPPPPADDARLAGGDLEKAPAAPVEERALEGRPEAKERGAVAGRVSPADVAREREQTANKIADLDDALEAEDSTLDDGDAPNVPVARAPAAAQDGDAFAPAPSEARKAEEPIARSAGGGVRMAAPTSIVAEAPRRAIQFNTGSAGAQPMADSLSVGGAPSAPMPQAAAQTVPQSLTEARAARARGDHRAAVGAYARYFERQPRDGQFSRSLFEAAASHEALGQIQQALRMYGLVPSTAGQWYVRARARISALRAARSAESEVDEADSADRVDPKPEPPNIAPPR